MNATSSQPSDLRERRKLETRREISSAALMLFESQGVTQTTVEQIAHLAGVSTRTFYRFCGAKERALLEDESGLEAAFAARLKDLPEGASELDTLHDFWAEMLGTLESDPEGRERFVRTHRVIAQEPTLIAVELRQDWERGERFVAALIKIRDLTGLRARTIVGVAWSMTLTAVEEWLAELVAGGKRSLVEIFADTRRELALASEHASQIRKSSPPSPSISSAEWPGARR